MTDKLRDLTAEDREWIDARADHLFRDSERQRGGIRPATIMPQDFRDYFVAQAAWERAALAAAPQPAPAPAADEALADYPVIPDTPEERAYRAGWNAAMGEMLKGSKPVPDEQVTAPAADEREALIEVLRGALPTWHRSTGKSLWKVQADALLAAGYRKAAALLAERDALWSLLRDGADLLDEARSEESEAWIARVAAMQTRWPKNPAREAWERFCYATTTKEHFAAVKALDDALGVKCGQSPLVFGTDDEDDAS